MTSALEVLKSIRVWQIVVLLGVVGLAAASTYAAFTMATAEEATDLEEDQRLVAVQRENFVNEISVNGTLVFTNRDTLSFGAAGTVSEVAFEEGQRVRAGDVLARLDGETISGLERKVVQAEGELRSAEEALAEARNPYTGVDLARAEADIADAMAAKALAEKALEDMSTPNPQAVARARVDIASAELSLRNAQEAPDRLMEPPSDQMVAKAKSDITMAKRTLREAQRALSELVEPSADTISAAEAAITMAKQEMDRAQRALDELTGGPDEELLAKAQSDLEAAQATLKEAQLDRSLTRIEWNDTLDAAQEKVGMASDDYAAVFVKWLGATLTEEELTSPPSAVLAAWDADLEALLAGTERYGGYRTAISSDQTRRDDPETPWNELLIFLWVNFYPGEIVATCDEGAAPPLGICIMRDLEEPWTTLEAKRDALETVKLQARRAIEGSESAIGRAERAITDVQQRMVKLQEKPDELDVEASRSRVGAAALALESAETALAELTGPADLDVEERRQRVEHAETALDAAREALEELSSGPEDGEVEAARIQIVKARINLESAQASLESLLAQPAPVEVEASLKGIALADANIADLKRRLAEIQAGADPLVASLREGDVAAAKSTLAALHEQLEQSVITAPWDGIVTKVTVEEGQDVGLGVSAIDMVDPATVEVAGAINEIDVLLVREGTEAAITLDALPGQVLIGTVTEIGAQTTSQEVGQFNPFSPQTSSVLYPITIQVQPPEGVELPEGLTALASVVIEEEPDVLLVPIDALFGTFDQPVLKVMIDGLLEERQIRVGSTDDFWAVVESGAAEGEMVVLETRMEGGFGRFGRFGGGSVTIIEE